MQDMSKNKSAKYKITDTDIDKKFIGKQVTVEKVKAKGGPDGGKKPPKPKAPAWFTDFRNEVMQRFDSQDKRFDKLEKEVSSLRSDFDRVIELNELES